MCYTFTMRYSYTTIYEKQAAFFRSRPTLIGVLLWASRILTAVFALAYFGLTAWLFCQKQYVSVICVLSAFALCLLTVWVLRLAVDRKRPFEADGANISPLIPKAKTGRSFPSRHAACAFTVATLFVPFAWAIAAALFLLGMVICYSRFALGWHYPSDLCGGAGLGVLCGLLILIA